MTQRRPSSQNIPLPEPPTVLVVDDDASLREALSSLFRSVGLDVRSFASAPGLLQSKLPDAPTCLVLDIRLPGLSGLDFQAQLAKANIHIPIIIVTGHGDIPMSVRAMKAGAVDFLTKPVQPEEVQARVQTHLQIRELQSSLEEKNRELAEEIDLRLDAEKQLETSLEQALLVTNRRGQILFATGQARILLNTFFSRTADNRLPDELCAWLNGPESQKPRLISHRKRGEIEIAHFALSKSGNLSLLRIEHRNGDNGPKALLALGVTAREAEVLYWMAEGKTNPEIAIIIDASLNTVKKHAINLFAKLGVETRTTAARLALTVLTPPAKNA